MLGSQPDISQDDSMHDTREAAPADPFGWLEAIDSEAVLAWVGHQNSVTLAELESAPGYAPLQRRLAKMFNASDRIPYVVKHGPWYYNFWRDATHLRGLWRRTTLEQYCLPEPAWHSVLDLDQLAREEGENWVWAGVRSLPPDGERCLVLLSRGGGDACVVREFDLQRCAFVPDGFALPEGKSDVTWIDRDHLLVAADTGPGTMTRSGYPRQVRQWRRGTPVAGAPVVFEGLEDDLGVSGYQVFTPGFQQQFIRRQMSFYTSELYLREGAALRRIDKPDDANALTVRDQLLIELRSDWQAGAILYPRGALLSIGLRPFLDGARDFETLFTPGPTRSLDGMTVTRHALLLTELDNVSNRLAEYTRHDGRWQRRVVTTPAFGSVDVAAADRHGSDAYFMTANDFLTPPSLHLGQVGSDVPTLLKSLPAVFDAATLSVTQHHARSADGTAVPYFVVKARHTPCDGTLPTVLYGYGGFEISLKPGYSGATGAAWLSQGGAYVVANIRGGGEFGPAWHQAALRQHRQRAFDDFVAVAEDLIARAVTSARHLGIMGGSNGGLLVGAAMTQRPELFRAVVCQVPLLDMRRYHRLLAGASWMGEYGNPDDGADWAFLARYSPYHNVHAGRRYPRMLLTTSTRDDRVHPGHARKMAALMQSQGHDVLYWENTDGGHAGAADNAQQARMWALTYTFLRQMLQ
ncbi:prolyl oligopeptidase family serine peptidase [Massilia sp. PAMC28688]|nr:prolyl oligopeptidase family serine peptidase [Massilia sp. PAMC28688]